MPTLHGGHTTAAVKDTVLGLQSIAARLRKARFSAGALRLDKVKVGFKLVRFTILLFPLFISVFSFSFFIENSVIILLTVCILLVAM